MSFGGVMVKSRPIRVNGMGGVVVHFKEGTGWNAELYSLRPGSLATVPFVSMSILEPLSMMIAVLSMVHKMGAVSLCIRSCVIVFEM